MFADLGHFTVKSMQIAFSFFVFPALLCSYIGQAAFLMKNQSMDDVTYTFYRSIPSKQQLAFDCTHMYRRKYACNGLNIFDRRLRCRACLLANVRGCHMCSDHRQSSNDFCDILYDPQRYGTWLFPSGHNHPHVDEGARPDLYPRNKLDAHGLEHSNCRWVSQYL